MNKSPLLRRSASRRPLAFRRLTGATFVAIAATLAAPADAKPLRLARASDLSTWDIHAQNVAVNNSLHSAIYDTLVEYDDKLFKPKGSLATGWQQVNPTQLRLTLRQGVKFSDGTPFTAEDAKFSLERAKAKSSNFAVYTLGIDRVQVVNATTLDVYSEIPNPVLVNQLTELRMMSRAWAQANNSLEPKDIRTKDETHAHRNALGTGPFMLQAWAPDQRVVLVSNPHWWGRGLSQYPGNVTQVTYTPIKSDATRMAALLSGEVDMVHDPALQDLPRVRASDQLKVLEGPENRTIFLGMDQFRDELPGSDVKGKNPLKDVRVRRALYQAIDIAAIQRVTLRGQSQPTGTLIARQINGWTPQADARLPYSPEAAKKLMQEAGYPQGFEIDFACSTGRYIADEALCQAITSQWARIGVRAKLRTLPFAIYFPMIQRNEASIYLLGWSVPTFDAFYSLQSLVRTPGAGGDGNFNLGRFSDPQLDAMIERIRKETQAPTRNQLIATALMREKELVSHLPLHNQINPWAMRRNVQLPHRADNQINWRVLRVD